MENARAAAAYLDSIKRDYPFGIPRACIKNTYGKKVFFIGEIQGAAAHNPFIGPAGELLSSAIRRGMKLEFEEVEVFQLGAENESATLVGLLATAKPTCIVCLGEQAAQVLRESGATLGSAHLCVTKTLTEVLSDAELKRTFWEDLKRVLTILSP